MKIWAEFPADDLEFWLYALNHHRESGDAIRGYGSDIPDFMKHVSDLAPIAGELQRMKRAREIDDWRDFFTGNRTVIAESGRGSQCQESELRLCLKPEFAALEVRRPGAAGFRVLSLADFKGMTDKLHPKRVPFDTRSELLLRRMDHKAYIGNSHRLRREDAEDMRALHSILNSPTLRGALVDDFQAHEGAGIFLISLKAGGSGLNLTAASYVVLFDPWWNPAVENQAIDRTHRIGQTSKVIAYRLLIKNTVEEKIRELQKTKQALAEDVLGEEKFSQSLTVEDFQFLLED